MSGKAVQPSQGQVSGKVVQPSQGQLSGETSDMVRSSCVALCSHLFTGLATCLRIDERCKTENSVNSPSLALQIRQPCRLGEAPRGLAVLSCLPGLVLPLADVCVPL